MNINIYIFFSIKVKKNKYIHTNKINYYNLNRRINFGAKKKKNVNKLF